MRDRSTLIPTPRGKAKSSAVAVVPKVTGPPAAAPPPKAPAFKAPALKAARAPSKKATASKTTAAVANAAKASKSKEPSKAPPPPRATVRTSEAALPPPTAGIAPTEIGCPSRSAVEVATRVGEALGLVAHPAVEVATRAAEDELSHVAGILLERELGLAGLPDLPTAAAGSADLSDAAINSQHASTRTFRRIAGLPNPVRSKPAVTNTSFVMKKPAAKPTPPAKTAVSPWPEEEVDVTPESTSGSGSD